MTGLVNNPFVPDANSMTHYGTVMSVAALTEIRRGTISRALISDREFVHITARMKNVSGTASSVILNLDGVDFGSVSVTADSQWHNYTGKSGRTKSVTAHSFLQMAHHQYCLTAYLLREKLPELVICMGSGNDSFRTGVHISGSKRGRHYGFYSYWC